VKYLRCLFRPFDKALEVPIYRHVRIVLSETLINYKLVKLKSNKNILYFYAAHFDLIMLILVPSFLTPFDNSFLLNRDLRSSMVPRSVRFGVRSRNLSNVGQSWDGWPKIYYLELLRASEGTLSNQPALGPRGGLWPVLSSGDINRLMMMMTKPFILHTVIPFHSSHPTSMQFFVNFLFIF
jgi:hypothetical protein